MSGSIHRKTIEARDIRLLFALGASTPFAWLAPPGLWPAFSGSVASYKTHAPWETTPRLPGFAPEILASRGVSTRIEDIEYEMDVHRHLLRMQVLRLLSPWGWRPSIKVDGKEVLDEALGNGSGAILWMSHFIYGGSVGKLGFYENGYKLCHLSRPEHGFSKTRFGIRVLNPIRCISEDRYLACRIRIGVDNMVAVTRMMKRQLADNNLVSITAGAWEGRQFVEGEIFGCRMRLATGAPALAHATGSPLVPVFVVATRIPNNYTIYVEKPLETGLSLSKQDAVRELTGEFLLRTEKYVLQFPAQWRAWSKLTPGRHTV